MATLKTLSLTQAQKWIYESRHVDQIARPMTYTTRTAMRDAGDHLTSLDGRCDNLNFDLRKPSHDIQLRWECPISSPMWQTLQRRNKVNVEERENRQLGFVHRDNFDSKLWEICAVPSKRTLNGHPLDFFRRRAQPYHKTTIKKSPTTTLTSAIDDVRNDIKLPVPNNTGNRITGMEVIVRLQSGEI